MAGGSTAVVRAARAAGVWLAASAAAAAAAGLVLDPVRDLVRAAADALGGGQWPDPTFDRLLVWVAGVAVLGCVAWLWLMTTLLTAQVAVDAACAMVGRAPVIRAASEGARIGRVPGPVAADRSLSRQGYAAVRSPGPRGCPAWLRTVVLAGCGVALVSGVAAPALADAAITRLDGDDGGRRAGPEVVAGLPMPDRAPPTAADRLRLPHVRRAPGAAGDGPVDPRRVVVTVRPGDSLWLIAETLLPQDASLADIAGLTHRLHARNRHEIGPDPDLIRPGQRLRLPPLADDPASPRRPSRPGAAP